MNPYTCSKEEFLKQALIPVRIVKDEFAMYDEMARLMAEKIVENNRKGEKTVMIVPVGPIAQYPRLVKLINDQKISLKNVWFINMDEYLTDDDKPISVHDPLSFHMIMNRDFYSKVDAALVMPESQRLFPEPGKEREIDALIDSLGKVDMCLTGVGINGHIAFNEPPEADDPITDEGYKNSNTRRLNISKETVVNNGSRKIRGALDIFPKRCITLGMRQLLKAETLKVYLNCDWQWGIMRNMALERENRTLPVSFLQSHSNAEMIISEDLYNFSLADIK